MPIRVQTPGGIAEFPDGTPPSVMEQALRAQFPTPASSHEEPPPSEHPHARVGRFVRENLPMLGGGAAALATGGVGLIPAIATAALGGGAGRIGQVALDRMEGKPTPEGAALVGDVAQTGAIQGALEGAGGLAGKGLSAAGHGIYRGLLKPSKGLRESFGGKNIVRTLVKEGAPISPRGETRMTGSLGASRDAALGLVKRAEDLGDPGVQASEVLPSMRSVVEELRKRADIGQPSELAKVGQRGRSIARTANRTAGIPLTRAQTLKETAQDAASGAYRQMERGTVPQVSAEGLLDTAVARGLREAIEKRVPGVGPQNVRTQELLGGKRALEDAVERGSNNLAIGGMRDAIALGAGAGVGGYAGGEQGATIGTLLALLTRPGMGSRAAIGMDRAGQLPIAQILRGLLSASHGTTEPGSSR